MSATPAVKTQSGAEAFDVARIREEAVGEEISRALNPSQQVVKIVHQELVKTLGEPGRLDLKGRPPYAIMLVGLQGSGKTTAAAN